MSNLPEAVLIARALGRLRESVPGGPNGIAVAAMDSLAQIGDLVALEAAEDQLATNTVGISYGDRDDDPPDWEPDPRTFAALARWWARLGLSEGRAAWLVAGELGDPQPRGETARRLFWRVAPHVARHAAPLLLAALDGARSQRRARIAYALHSTPTEAAIGALILLLGDPGQETRRQAALAIGVLSAGDHMRAPVVALARPPDPAPLLRVGSTDQLPAESARHCYAVFYRIADRLELLNSIADTARNLADPDPGVRRRSAGLLRLAALTLEKLSPDEAARLAQMLAADPSLDLLGLLSDPDPSMREAALALAGRTAEEADPPRRSALILAVAELLGGPQQLLAVRALERLRARRALPQLRAVLGRAGPSLRQRAPLILGRLGDQSAVPGLEEMLANSAYAAEALEVLGELRRASRQPAGALPVRYGRLELSRHELSYLARHGDADALARVQRTEEYAFAAAHMHRCSDADMVVAAAREIEGRLLRAAGLSQAEIDSPLEAVRRALVAPVHPSRLEGHFGGPLEGGEPLARWQDLCIALGRHGGSPLLEEAVELAAGLLTGWPDEPRVAHEGWWLEVLRNQGGQLVYSRQVIRAAPLPRPRPPFALARAVHIGPGLSLALDPAAALAWLARSGVPIIELDLAPDARGRWERALAEAGEGVRARVLR